MLRSRRSQRDGGGLPAPCIRWPGHDRSSHLSDDHGGPSTFVGVVGGKRVHACGNGGDRRLLESRLEVSRIKSYHASYPLSELCRSRAISYLPVSASTCRK